jgi:hypothetical protein
MANKQNNEVNPDIEALRAQIEDELRTKMEAEKQEEIEQAKQDAINQFKAKELNLEKQIEKQEKTLKQQLEAMPKKTIEIPVDENNPDDVAVVGWNGIIYTIPKGQPFEVPEVIYNIWKESHTKTLAVQKKIRESINKEIKIAF